MQANKPDRYFLITAIKQIVVLFVRTQYVNSSSRNGNGQREIAKKPKVVENGI